MALFSQNHTLISALFAATSAPRHRCVECKINKGCEANPERSAQDFFPNRKESSSLCSSPLPACPWAGTEEDCGLLAVVLVLCTSVLAQLWRRTEKKKLFITVRVAQISYPGLVLGQFYKAEVWKKSLFSSRLISPLPAVLAPASPFL